ncbi:MAG TPA: AI-2E family transporter, partial [Gemmatimonadales bacterium]|nr:AI-2E family transporter [Gemmatimonadales bacterium]
MSYIDERSPLLRAVLLVAGLVIIAAGMKATATVVNLILLSILLATTLVPLTVILTQRGMGRGAAIALTAVLALVGGALLIMVLTRSISRLSENLPTYQAALGGLVDNVTDKLAARGIAVDQAMKPDPAKIMGRIGGLLGAALGLVGYGLLAIVLVVLFLIEMPVISAGDAGAGSVRARLDQAMRLVRRFVGLNGLIGVIIAVIDLAIMLLMGTDGAVLWAVICFLFAFVPFGFMLSLIPPFILTLLEHGPARGAALFGLFFVVNFIGDNVIKPKIMGSGLGLSPLLIVIALLVWGAVLGPMGALLAIPLTLAVKEILPIFT